MARGALASMIAVLLLLTASRATGGTPSSRGGSPEAARAVDEVGDAPKKRRMPLVHGHRGARARFPENTLPAFRHAIDVGAHVIELDVVATKDDVLAVMHDPVVNEELCTWRGDGPPMRPFVVRAHTYDELARSFDCGAKKNPRFPEQEVVPGTPIPTLDDVLALVAKPGVTVHVNVEAKTVPARTDESPPPARFAALIVDAIERRGLVARAIVQSFDHDVLRAVAARAPKLRRAALVDQTHGDPVGIARAARASIYSPHHEWLTHDDVRALRRARIEAVPWTANTPLAWSRLVELGVDGIITDDPRALLAWLEQPTLDEKGRSSARE